ncbi:MAG TPA: VTT domain-containing protein [Afifellaceae bacterium]|nr:VTT domain-containing protein [Afifellaceae bacterium]
MTARTFILLLLAATGLAAAAIWLWNPSYFAGLVEAVSRENVEAIVARAGFWGPMVIIGMMTVAVVASPVPSAPIALAAGAAYGHTWGTIQVVIGAEAGALIAFALARILGRDVLERWFGDRLDAGLFGSQNMLTAIIFASRLMPFVSFDMISYAAGLSCLHMWRFALATLAGVIPASFLLAHFGGEVAAGEMGAAMWLVLLLGLITGAPLIWAAVRSTRKTGGEKSL